MEQYFNIDAAPMFKLSAVAPKNTQKASASAVGAQATSKRQPLSLDAFVQLTGPLLEMEHAAEVGQVRAS